MAEEPVRPLGICLWLTRTHVTAIAPLSSPTSGGRNTNARTDAVPPAASLFGSCSSTAEPTRPHFHFHDDGKATLQGRGEFEQAGGNELDGRVQVALTAVGGRWQ